MFVLPVVVFFATFSIFPVLYGLYLSFTRASLLQPPHWIGEANYLTLPSDPLFRTALSNTLIFVLGTTVPVWLASLGAALLFHQRFPARDILKTLFFLPVLPPLVVVAVIWKVLLDPLGVVTWLGSWIWGPGEIAWLYNTTLAPLMMIIVHDWAAIPFYMMIWLAGLTMLSRRPRISTGLVPCVLLARGAAAVARHRHPRLRPEFHRSIPDFYAAIRAEHRSGRPGECHPGARSADFQRGRFSSSGWDMERRCRSSCSP